MTGTPIILSSTVSIVSLVVLVLFGACCVKYLIGKKK